MERGHGGMGEKVKKGRKEGQSQIIDDGHSRCVGRWLSFALAKSSERRRA
jgi:hypothetical protein